jgi:hypothetical protein
MTAATIIGLLTTYGPMIITGAAAAAAALPQAKSGTPWAAVRKVLDLFALNFGNAKNMPLK